MKLSGTHLQNSKFQNCTKAKLLFSAKAQSPRAPSPILHRSSEAAEGPAPGLPPSHLKTVAPVTPPGNVQHSLFVQTDPTCSECNECYNI